ncbi:MAG: hypothetical protein KBT03_12795 [Bacteroidales bacterium]|nr:hypothetical protein [Candidatus Scybalousia scybalohippi]
MEKLKEIEIAGKKLPIKCNIDCLIAIQEEFEDFKSFEEKLIGVKRIEEKVTYTTPSIKAIAFSLPMFIRCGIKEYEIQGKTVPDVDLDKAIEDVDFNIIETALFLYEEFERCFHRKKSTAQRNTTSIHTTKTKKDK